jgi:hypothetical protein
MPGSDLIHRARTTVAFAAAGSLLALWTRFAPVDDDTTFYEKQTLKHRWRGCADVVIAGDSATAWTIDPAVVAMSLPGIRVVNFGFESASWTAGYLAGIDRVLDAGSRARAVVLGFSESTANSGNDSWPEWEDGEAAAASDPGVRVDRTWSERVEIALQPRQLCTMVFGACDHRFTSGLGPAGVLPHSLQPPDPGRNRAFVEADLRVFTPYGTTHLEPLFERVRAWRAAGVIVTGFWVPVEASTVELAKRRGLSTTAINERFVAAGGVLLDLPRTAATFDGEHMTPEAARSVSQQLGVQLAVVVAPGHVDAQGRPTCAWSVP